MNYYVYYKLSPEQLVKARAAVQALFEAAQTECGVRGRWMHRRDDPSTYMEVYEDVKDEAAFEALLKRLGAQFGVARHVERFVNA
jgi:hypothetical protein